jgi:glycosyltransferase involved in cell wall biosynthesis
MKIVYVIASLETSGGTERIISEKANYLAEVFGYDVSVICFDQRIDSPNFYFLSGKVNQINLGVQIYSQYRYKYPKRLWKKIIFRNRLSKRLSSTINIINPEILIGISHFRADFVCTVNCKAKIIIESHIPRSFIENTYYSNNLLVNYYKKLYDKRYFHGIEKKADIIISLTEGDHQQWKKAKRIEIIPNFSNIDVHHIYDFRKKRVIAIGRLFKEKGFDRLLDIWKLASDKHPDWQLDIFGDGVMKEELEQKIISENIHNVTLRGTTNNIGKEISNSSICLATSYYEGFSLVLLEAIKHGVPCIAFDCPYGPRTIIQDRKCGFLVENGNKHLFAVKLCTLMEDEQLRQQFSKAAIERSKVFDKDTIMLQWKKLFESCN